MATRSKNARVHRPKRSGTFGNLTTSIIHALKRMIADGDIQHGSKLPAERDLASRFGVNRASLRQALKALEVMGVLRQRVGDGTYLTDDASSTLSAPLDFLLLVDGITFSELYEARQIFEPELASRAARRRTAGELVQLEKSVTDMKRYLKSGSLADVAACDQRFHRLIWEMAGNRVCLRMFVPLHRIMTESFAITWTINDYTNAISAHSGIFEAIGAGDTEAARQHMIEHLDRAQYIHVSHARQGTEAPANCDSHSL